MFKYFADLITFDLLKLQRGSHIGESLNFFFYDVPKIYVLLLLIIFVVAIIRSFLPPEKIRAILSRKNEFTGNILAACLGIFTPFCTCSAIPLFMGMLQSGVPLGVTMSFLVASPTINEVAVILLWGLFGIKVALTYILSGLLIAIVAGFIIGRLKMERYRRGPCDPSWLRVRRARESSFMERQDRIRGLNIRRIFFRRYGFT